MPVGLALANQAVLAAVCGANWPETVTGLLFPFYAVQVGCVSWSVGRYVTPWPLRWIIWLWIMALIDLQLAVLTTSIFNAPIYCLAAGILAGQLGAFVVWGILGSGEIVWRIPSLGVILLAAWNVYELLVRIAGQDVSWLQLNWSNLLNVQVVTLSALCCVLRLYGYSLRITGDETAKDASQPGGREPVQFGIRHVVIWTTALAVLLGIAKAGDLLTARFLQRGYAVGLGLVATAAIATAMLLLVSIWASLGRGRAATRILVLVLSSLVVGAPFAWYAVYVGKPQMAMNPDYRFVHWYGAGYWWLGWMFLTATLLAAALLIFRTLGYRLVWTSRSAALGDRAAGSIECV